MSYKSKRRESLDSIVKKWRWSLFVYFVTFVFSLLSSSPTESEFLTISIWTITITTNIYWAVNIVLNETIILIIGSIFLFLILKYIILHSWKADGSTLRERLLKQERRLQTLFGISSGESIIEIEDEFGFTFWELLFLRNYLRYTETTIRQKIRAFEKLPGGIGIVADDLAAGYFATACLIIGWKSLA